MLRLERAKFYRKFIIEVKDKLKRLNYIMFGAMLALIACGTIAIYSAGHSRADIIFHSMWKSNLYTAIFALGLYFMLAFTDYKKILKWGSTPLYVTALLLLIIVLIFGTVRLGGKRWLWFFQPSEISKLCILSFISYLIGSVASPLGEMRHKFRGFLILSLLVAIPVVLILEEPDLGTALTLLAAILVMFFIGRVWRAGLVTLIATGAILATCVLGAVYEAERPGTTAERKAAILKYVPLEPHQVKRVKVFLFPDEDIHDSGYNLRQAKISIGSGGLTGKGIGKGELNGMKYLPQSISMNDFIFCVWAEETGFVGSIILLTLFGIVILSGVWIAYRAEEPCGRLLAIGITTLFFAHVYINIAMSIGLVPITGLPLPFISSGRTFLVTMMLALGLVQSVSIHGRSGEIL